MEKKEEIKTKEGGNKWCLTLVSFVDGEATFGASSWLKSALKKSAVCALVGKGREELQKNDTISKYIGT